MTAQPDKKALISRLQKDILQWEGYKPPPAGTREMVGLGAVETVFPNGVFPLGTVHELVCATTEEASASSGFISGILSVLMRHKGACLWISCNGSVFPSALSVFGIEPDRVIFIQLPRQKDLLWVIEEALKCHGLAAVVGEVKALDFKQSRRLQLAVERSQVTGFILRNQSDKTGSTACAARWKISQLPSEPENGMPGLGLPRWQVELLRVRNGKTGSWVVEWCEGKFRLVQQISVQEHNLMAG